MSRTNKDLVAPKGIGALDKLKNIARAANKPMEQVAQRYALEGAIRRIFSSEHAEKFGMTLSLKGGALMFFSEGVDPVNGRATADIDIQIGGYTGDMKELAAIMKEVLATVPAQDDGVRFDIDQIDVASVRDGGVPGGAVTTVVQIGTMVLKFKADVGFYAPEIAETLVEVDYPSLLPGMPSMKIRRQPIEYSISDKIHAAFKHGGKNSRLRDFYDMYVMLTKCTIDDDHLRAAFEHSWPMYGATVPGSVGVIEGISDDWATEHEAAWKALRMESAWAVQPPSLREVCALIRARLKPVLNAGPLLRPAA